MTLSVSHVLLDIEGTTTPLEFAYRTLFPYARAHAADYLARHEQTAACQEAVALLREESEQEEQTTGRDASPRELLAYIEWIMDRDRKSRGLKALQGLIWEEGYRSGELRGQVFPDVKPALDRWRATGRQIYIFSSGSVLAQQCLFASTNAGDLTPLIDGYFDTAIGQKHIALSYHKIVARLGVAPAQVLFISDIDRELDAAREAGLHTVLCIRSSSNPRTSHPIIRSFDELAA